MRELEQRQFRHESVGRNRRMAVARCPLQLFDRLFYAGNGPRVGRGRPQPGFLQLFVRHEYHDQQRCGWKFRPRRGRDSSLSSPVEASRRSRTASGTRLTSMLPTDAPAFSKIHLKLVDGGAPAHLRRAVVHFQVHQASALPVSASLRLLNERLGVAPGWLSIWTGASSGIACSCRHWSDMNLSPTADALFERLSKAVARDDVTNALPFVGATPRVLETGSGPRRGPTLTGDCLLIDVPIVFL